MIFQKKVSMKLGDYFQILKPQYVFLKLKPHTGIRNYDSASIINAFHSLYRSLYKRIYRIEKVWVKEPAVKCTYIIDIHKEKVDFYFVVPKLYKDLAEEKIRGVWPQIEIEVLDKIEPFSPEAVKYELAYKNEDGLSLKIDKKTNDPLNKILGVINVMETGDRVTLLYNFMPCSQFGWSVQHDKTIVKLRNKVPVDKDKMTLGYIGKYVFSIMVQILDGAIQTILEVLGADFKKKNEDLAILSLAITTINVDKDLKEVTREKRNSPVINTQMLVLSDGEDRRRSHTNAIAVCQSFNSIKGDNELKYKHLKSNAPVRAEQFRIPCVVNKLSIDECHNLMQLPGRDLLREYKNIENIDVTQTPPVDELSKGVLRVGLNDYRGAQSYIYHTEHVELRNTAICITGPNRSGKTTYLINIILDALSNGRSVLLPDFCGKCKTTNELLEAIPKEKVLVIDCGDLVKLQGFGYNEIVPKDNTPFELYNCAKIKAARLKELINLVNDESNDLEGRMERYLEYAALIVFINNGPVNDVFKILKDHNLRHKYIDSIPAELKNDMEEYIFELCEIDEIAAKGDSAGEIVGTKHSHVSAILSRIHRLKQNSYIELMLKKGTEDNINLLEEIQKGKLICLKMYDTMFATQQQKDIYVCYWITKFWGILQKRYCDCLNEEDLVQTILLIDELYQTRNAEKYLTKILSQMPKYRGKLVLSCHHLAQIPTIQEELKSASCSYMFIRGSNKKNFYAMKEEFEDKGFVLEDLLHLKQYQAICLLAYEDGYWSGIVQLPGPLTVNE